MVKSSERLIPAARVGLVKTAWRFWKDPRARKRDKAVLFFWWLYGISPIDVIPDVIPAVGMIDDVGVFVWAMYLLLWASRRYREHVAIRPVSA